MLPLFVGLVLDTSALIYIVERRVDISQLYKHKVFVPAAVVEGAPLAIKYIITLNTFRRAF